MTSKPVRNSAISLAILAGVTLLLVGWTDLILLWLPFRPSSPEWEFGASSSFIDALPLATIGLVILGLASISADHRKLLRGLSIFAWFVALALIGISFFFASGLPIALRSVQGPMREVLALSILKTSILATIYLVFYVWFAVLSWKGSGSGRTVGIR